MTVQGQIFDNEMGSIESVNVFEIGTTNSTQTDVDGRFTLTKVASSNSDIRFTHVAYDYDTVKASYFDKMSYLQLYPNSNDLGTVSVGGQIKPKTNSNSIWIILAILGIGLYAVSKKDAKPVSRTVPTKTVKKQPLKVRL
jgi:hypothetical protein